MPSILINGRESDHISVLDRGLQYGDGLFETIRITEGVPQYWQGHVDRLFAGCDRLHVPRPDLAVLQSEAMSLCENIGDGVLKLIITRGEGGRGYMVPDEIMTTRIVAMFPAPKYSEDCWSKGIVVRVCDTRLGLNPALAGIKHLNRLEQVLARAEWNDAEIHEGLMLDAENYVIEGTMSNVYCVKNNELITPDISRCGVKGIIRDQVIKIAQKLGINMYETNFTLDTLYDSDEIFVTNSVIGLWPVRQLENHQFKVGTVSQQISEILNNKKHGIENVA